MATKTIAMGAAGTVEVQGCCVLVDGEVMDGWSAKASTARAGWQVWTLSAEQVAALLASPGGCEARSDHPMRGFHR